MAEQDQNEHEGCQALDVFGGLTGFVNGLAEGCEVIEIIKITKRFWPEPWEDKELLFLHK